VSNALSVTVYDFTISNADFGSESSQTPSRPDHITMLEVVSLNQSEKVSVVGSVEIAGQEPVGLVIWSGRDGVCELSLPKSALLIVKSCVIGFIETFSSFFGAKYAK
jgi:hypothetical protein